MAAAARMYLKGVSTRDVEDVLAEMGIEGMSATQVSNATKKLDGELEAWRTRALAETKYLILDARYEKVRIDGVARDAAILILKQESASFVSGQLASRHSRADLRRGRVDQGVVRAL